MPVWAHNSQNKTNILYHEEHSIKNGEGQYNPRCSLLLKTPDNGKLKEEKANHLQT